MITRREGILPFDRIFGVKIEIKYCEWENIAIEGSTGKRSDEAWDLTMK